MSSVPARTEHPFVGEVRRLHLLHGEAAYDDVPGQPFAEAVTLTDHMLQCAALAEAAGADDDVVLAAFLHDLGHFVENPDGKADVDYRHQVVAEEQLRPVLGERVARMVGLHVDAKRYLVATDPSYSERLSPASVHSLELQGGPMNEAEAGLFESTNGASDAARIRRWDDDAKVADVPTPDLEHYLAMLDQFLHARADNPTQFGG